MNMMGVPLTSTKKATVQSLVRQSILWFFEWFLSNRYTLFVGHHTVFLFRETSFNVNNHCWKYWVFFPHIIMKLPTYQSWAHATTVATIWHLFVYFFGLRLRFPPLPWNFYSITQWSCSAPGSLWEMPDSNPHISIFKGKILSPVTLPLNTYCHCVETLYWLLT